MSQARKVVVVDSGGNGDPGMAKAVGFAKVWVGDKERCASGPQDRAFGIEAQGDLCIATLEGKVNRVGHG
jgi:hypothetical protein